MNNWIYTDGAPFICATPSTRKLWRGVQGTSVGASESDYDRVCEATGYLSTLACGPFQVLALGDEPAQATFLLTPNGPIIARWIACDSMELADAVLARIPGTLPHLQPPVRFQLNEPEMWMFDSSFDGASASSAELTLGVPLGNFDVTTESYREGTAFEFWLHRFVQTSA